MMLSISEGLQFLSKLREIDSDMPMAQAHCLLLIAKNEGLSLKELADRADVGMASASRYISKFSKPMSGRKGLGLVIATEDPLERRKKIIELTPKGRAFIETLTGESRANIQTR
jgi:DNA-binding MarR family transcriptional regulator